MNKKVVGYVSVLLSVLVAILALASLSEKPISYGTSTALTVLALAFFGVSWVTLLGQPSAPPTV
jgi:hypothetical protein